MLEECSAIGQPFDTMDLSERTYGQPLTVMSYWVLRHSGVIRDLELNAKKLIKYV
jgi:hypothetical protein